MQQRYKILDDSLVFKDFTEESKEAIFNVVKYSFFIIDPDWTLSGSVEWEDIRDLITLGKHQNSKYKEIY